MNNILFSLYKWHKRLFLLALLTLSTGAGALVINPHMYTGYNPDHSSARNWSEVLIVALRGDDGNVAVNARNVFHFTAAVYDAWAVYDRKADTFLAGKTVGGYRCALSHDDRRILRTFTPDIKAARDTAISFAAYRLLSHRYQNSTGRILTQFRLDTLMESLGYNINFTSTDYGSGSAAALGNYIGQCYIEFGLQDGSNQQGSYSNQFYQPVNNPLDPALPGTGALADPNRWQNLVLSSFITKTGNIASVPDFQAAEWGRVAPFAFSLGDANIYQRDGTEYWVYEDPGAPPHLVGPGADPEEFKWTFELVAIMSSHLDPTDGVMWDISPASIGNNSALPETLEGHRDFFDLDNEGGDSSRGHTVNPVTGMPYTPQIVPRADYIRSLVQYWADGPFTAETPAGYWIQILNTVSDHPQLEKRFRGTGPVLDDLEWDVKAYFTMGGVMHDVAVTVWGIKGWYDYARPITAIRYMAGQGQSSDPTEAEGCDYSPIGISLIPGFIECVDAADPDIGNGFITAGDVGKIKIFSWPGPEAIATLNPGGAEWILGENWWPYMRENFVTPPFAGYVSGHSTLTRAGAEVMTILTGDEYFPDGVSEFPVQANNFLVYENGPSVNLTLQWATYRDLADGSGISRLWGGVHPPVDDIVGRRIGARIGVNSFQKAEQYFNGTASSNGGGGALSVWVLVVMGLLSLILGRVYLLPRRRASDN